MGHVFQIGRMNIAQWHMALFETEHIPSSYGWSSCPIQIGWGFPIGVPLNHPIHFITIIVRCSMINSDNQSFLVPLENSWRNAPIEGVLRCQRGPFWVGRGHAATWPESDTPKKKIVLSGMSLSMMIKGSFIIVLIIIFFYHRISQCHPLD